MRNIRKILAIVIFLFVLLTAFYLFYLSPRYTVPILMYHRFGEQEGSLFVSPQNFARQMDYLKSKDYEVLSLDELVEGVKNNREFGHKSVVITIDDGYKDNYIYAYPILKQYNFSATIFIIANFIGNKEDFMSWDEVMVMSKDNISFGGHTKNEVYIPSIKEKQILWEETAGCKKLIESKIKSPVDYFCYPTGGFTQEAKQVLKKTGYKAACTTNRGFVELNKDVFELKRVKITNSDMTKPFNFWVKLSGYYNLFRSRKRGY